MSSFKSGMDYKQSILKIKRWLPEPICLPKLQLIPLELDSANKGIDVSPFSSMTEQLWSVNDKVLILTVKPGWMPDNM